jgi:DNA polymerase
MCDLGFQPEINGCCVSRGTFNTKKMIIGEAPGKEEDARGAPFTGPAGLLMDRIWESVGMSTNDWYITNVVKCRPVSPKGSGKENFTPRVAQRMACMTYIDNEITLLKPKLIVTVGGIATSYILCRGLIKIGEYRGKTIRSGSRVIFPMLHPAAILHAKRDPAKHQLYRMQMWEDIQKLKEIVEELNVS